MTQDKTNPAGGASRLHAELGDFRQIAALRQVMIDELTTERDRLLAALGELTGLAPPETEPHPPHRQCGCAECAPSFEPYQDAPNG
jgi:hypothetical protein